MPDEKTWEKELAQLQEKESEALRGGGEERLEKQRKMGKMTARERIDHIMDPGSFVEVNMLAEHQCQDFGMDKKKFLGDGVITGHGTINGLHWQNPWGQNPLYPETCPGLHGSCDLPERLRRGPNP
jgi:acetyl-CoA carboxylase carboxyltransferase component